MIPLDTWHSVEKLEKLGNDLVITLVPDYYDESKDSPVIEVTAEETEFTLDSEELNRLKQGWIVEAEINDDKLVLWEELADEPFVVKAKRVSYQLKDYSTDQLKSLISTFKKLLREEQETASNLRSKLDSSAHLVDELMNRTELKWENSKNKTIPEAQIKILKRLKNRLHGS